HDRYFLNKIAERIMELSEDGAEYFLGNYDDYLEKKQALVEIAEEQNEQNNSRSKQTAVADKGAPSDYDRDKQAKREERNRQRKLEQLENRINELEDAITQYETTMASPEVFHDHIKLQELQELRDAASAELNTCYEQ